MTVIRVKTWIDNCKFLLERAIARNLYNSSKLIYVAVLGREAIYCSTHGSSKQGKINVNTDWVLLGNG